MNAFRRILMVAGLIMLAAGLGWASPPNPTGSDSNFNTAGGAAALTFVTTGQNNTAFGDAALFIDVGGSNNTATGYEALANNNGNNNTAVGFDALLGPPPLALIVPARTTPRSDPKPSWTSPKAARIPPSEPGRC